MSDIEFRLEVGKEYVDGRDERHKCEEHDLGLDVFRCSGSVTGAGYYFAAGQIYVGPNAEESERRQPRMTLRPISE